MLLHRLEKLRRKNLLRRAYVSQLFVGHFWKIDGIPILFRIALTRLERFHAFGFGYRSLLLFYHSPDQKRTAFSYRIGDSRKNVVQALAKVIKGTQSVSSWRPGSTVKQARFSQR